MPVLVLSYTQKAGSVELYGHQTESTIKRHFIVGYTNGRCITYNRELISVCRVFHHLIKKHMHHLALVCTMYHSVIVLQLTHHMVYEQCHSRGEEKAEE